MKRYFSPGTKKVIFFDLNDTLVDQKQSYRSCFIEVLNEFTGRWDAGDKEWSPHNVVLRYEKKWTRERQIKRKSKLPLNKLQFSCLRYALKPYPLIVNDEFLQAFFTRIRKQQASHIKLYSNALDILSTLAKNYRLGLISNKKEIDLKQFGLSAMFSKDHVITSRNGYRKPHPSIFKLALKAMKVKASEAVMVGNSWKHDIYGATRSGIDAVWIHPAQKKNDQRKIGKERVIIIRNIKDLLDVFL